MKELRYEDLTPGIRLTVRWLRDHNFETTDSGDGVANVAMGMEEALDIPNVFMQCEPAALFSESERLVGLLASRGIIATPGMVEATYDPVDRVALVALLGVDDARLLAAGGPTP